MTKLLIRLFVKDYEDTAKERVRTSYGILSSATGLVINILLSSFKMIFGKLVNSISLFADGVNNLFDAISSVISLAGFRISGKPADKEHPFGHGRMEYVSAILLAFLVVITGFELIADSINKLHEPSPTVFTFPAATVLVVSIFAKLWMAYFNRKIGKAINSLTVNAVVTDSIGDILASFCTLVALIASNYTNFAVDAVMGMVVAVVILYGGIGIIKDTLGPLLGEPPSKEVVDKLVKFIEAQEGIIGTHDLVLHTYGHSKIMGSIHAEVDSNMDLVTGNDLIDHIEDLVKQELNIDMAIHIDPILLNDEITEYYKEKVKSILAKISSKITFHDFRIVDGPTRTNLIFDVVLPYSVKLSEQELRDAVAKALEKEEKQCFAVIRVDREYL